MLPRLKTFDCEAWGGPRAEAVTVLDGRAEPVNNEVEELTGSNGKVLLCREEPSKLRTELQADTNTYTDKNVSTKGVKRCGRWCRVARQPLGSGLSCRQANMHAHTRPRS
eukprot:43425-Pelagomonas_calceolata.AAC.1